MMKLTEYHLVMLVFGEMRVVFLYKKQQFLVNYFLVLWSYRIWCFMRLFDPDITLKEGHLS